MTVEEAKNIVLKEFPTASFLKVDIRFKDKARKYKHPEFMRAYDFLRKNDIGTAITTVADRDKFREFTAEIEPDSDVESEQNQETISEPEPKRTIKPEDKPKHKTAPRRCVVEKLRFDNKVLQNIVMQYCEEIGRLNEKIDNLIETNDYNFGNYLVKREECASLRKELAKRVVGKVNKQALHSAESALAFKDEVIADLKKRLKAKDEVITDLGKELKAQTPGPGEEQPKEKKGIIYPTTFPKADFYYKHVLNEGNPALKESASQFNDALLDEQAKKIEELTKDKELMKKATLSQLDDFIEIYNLLTKESQKTKRLGKEIARLNGIIHDKNAVLSDVAEELRLLKIREKNLVEVSQKYMKENEELREKVAEKTKLVEMVRKGSKEYCEYGIAAEKMIQKLAKIIVGKESVTSEDFEKCRRWAKGYRFNPQLPELSEEEEKKLKSSSVAR